MERQTRGVITAGDLRTFSLSKPGEAWPIRARVSRKKEPARLKSGRNVVAKSTALSDGQRNELTGALDRLRKQYDSLPAPSEQARTIINFIDALAQVVALPKADARVVESMESAIRKYLKDLKQPEPAELVEAVNTVLAAVAGRSSPDSPLHPPPPPTPAE